MKPVAYPIWGNISCYADCSNARQKVRLVGETLTGVVFPTGEIEVGVEKTLRVLADPQLEQSLRAQAEAHAANYDWPVIHERMAVVIREMLAK